MEKQNARKTFIALLDNYDPDIDQPENVTRKEVKEMKKFINIIVKKKVMQTAHQFLVGKQRAPNNMKQFKRLLHKLWFSLIRRRKTSRYYDSSSFEHVFVGENSKRTVIGFHNWIQFYLQEKSGNIDHKRYFRTPAVYHNNEQRLVRLQFTWMKNLNKRYTVFFLGCSPEFEIAMYTVCHLMRVKRAHVKLQEYDIVITHYPLGKVIGTVFIGI